MLPVHRDPMREQELGPVPTPRPQVKFSPRRGGYHQPLNPIKAESLQKWPCVTEGNLFIQRSEPAYPLCSFLGDPFQIWAVSPPLPQGMWFRAVVPGGSPVWAMGSCVGTSGTTSIAGFTHGLGMLEFPAPACQNSATPRGFSKKSLYLLLLM